MLKKEYLKNKPSCKVTFSLPAETIEGVSEVQILGDFNNWNREQGIKMKSAKAGFETTLELAAGRYYEFRYLLDGNIWTNDPAADDYHATPFGVYNSVVKVEEVVAAKPAAKAPVAKTAAVKTPAAETTAKTAAPKKATTTKTTTAKAPTAETTVKTTAPKTATAKVAAVKAPAAEKTAAPAKPTAKAAPKKTKKA